MRLSTSIIYELGLSGIQRQQAKQLELQQQISAGRRVLRPSDDPIAAASVISIDQARGLNAQYGTNAANAKAVLGLGEQALADATRVLQDVKSIAVTAGNPALKNEDRISLATQLRGLYDELLGIANRTDGKGNYLFSGYRGSTQPFSESAPGVVAYAGDEGHRLLQIAPQRRMSVGDSGAEVFQRIRAGNGTFVVDPNAGNTGTGVATAGRVTNAAAWANPANSGDYTIRFHVDNAVPPVTTYDIVDDVANVSMLTGAAPAAGPHARVYQPGVAIALERQAADPIATAWDTGIQLEVSGAPASGDSFDVRRSPMQDVFATVHELIGALRTGISEVPSSRAFYQNNLNSAGASLDRALDQILTARASLGSRLQEIDAVEDTTQDLAIRYEEDRSRLLDLDYAKALSDLARAQTNFEAAHRSYALVTRLKLFDFI